MWIYNLAIIMITLSLQVETIKALISNNYSCNFDACFNLIQLYMKFRESLKFLDPHTFLVIEKYTRSRQITDDSVSVKN